jgi:F-type H+-transporting ATPase subunit b
MPQFDVTGFSPQLIWLAITFVALFLLMWRVTLPKVADVFTLRQERIEGNLDKADKLKAEAEAVIAGYQKAIAEAKSLAQAELQRAAGDVAAETAKREAVFGQRLNDQATAAEGQIKAAKVQAMASVRQIAGELSLAMTTKLTGTAPSGSAAADAVASAIKERA